MTPENTFKDQKFLISNQCFNSFKAANFGSKKTMEIGIKDLF